LKLNEIQVSNNSSVTLGASMAGYSMIGHNWTLALGGQAIDGAYFEGATISGTGTCTTAAEFSECHIGAGTTTGPSTFMRCGFLGSEASPFTAGSAGQFLLADCFSEVAGAGTPYFSFPGACGVNIRRWSGGTNITLNNTSATLTVEVVTGGGQTIAVGGADVEIRGICRAVTLTGVASTTKAQINCVTGPISIAGVDGEVNIFGVCGVVTDSRTGTAITLLNKAVSQDTINAEVDTAVADIKTKTDYLPSATAGSAGGVFIAGSNAATSIMTALTANIAGNLSGSVGSVTAEVSADMVKISGDGTAADRLEAVLDATPTGLVVDDNDPDPLATAFETNLAEATNDHYNGAFLVFSSGTLLGQSRKISDYDGTSKVITVATAFTEAPAGGDTFLIVGRSE
jgi:hypothetical protein